jgi:type I restriction-modification system DNA methylase subunit
MVELTAPRPEDVICDPACGTAGFLVAPGEYLREHHPKVLTDKKLRDYESCAKSLQKVVKTKKTELLFVALILRLLKPGGRAAIIVPAGILESDSKAHDSIRKQLVNNNRLEAVIALPHWVFKTYASVATAILVIGSRGQTEDVLFYRMENDGFYDDAGKTKREGSEIPEIKSLFECFRDDDYEPKKRKHRVVTRAEILENEFDLCERVYLSGYEYPEGVPLRPLSDLFEIEKGKSGASKAVDDGKFPFVTSAE